MDPSGIPIDPMLINIVPPYTSVDDPVSKIQVNVEKGVCHNPETECDHFQASIVPSHYRLGESGRERMGQTLESLSKRRF